MLQRPPRCSVRVREASTQDQSSPRRSELCFESGFAQVSEVSGHAAAVGGSIHARSATLRPMGVAGQKIRHSHRSTSLLGVSSAVLPSRNYADTSHRATGAFQYTSLLSLPFSERGNRKHPRSIVTTSQRTLLQRLGLAQVSGVLDHARERRVFPEAAFFELIGYR